MTLRSNAQMRVIRRSVIPLASPDTTMHVSLLDDVTLAKSEASVIFLPFALYSASGLWLNPV
jgi:hypothetical protein